MHIYRGHTGGNTERCPLAAPEIIHNTGLATQKDELEQRMRCYWPI